MAGQSQSNGVHDAKHLNGSTPKKHILLNAFDMSSKPAAVIKFAASAKRYTSDRPPLTRTMEGP